MSKFQLIEGGRNSVKSVLTPSLKQSISDRFQYHGAKLSTLAWETGHTQGTLCAVIVEIARAESKREGIRQARFAPPVGRAA